MVDMANDLLLYNLKELPVYHADLIKDTCRNIDNLERDLCIFKGSFQRDMTVKMQFNNLKKLLVDQVDQIKDTSEDLARDLCIFKAFVRDTVKKWKKNEHVKELVKEIRDDVYEVEDTIDAFVTNAIEKRSESSAVTRWKYPFDLHTIGEKVEGIRAKVESCRREIGIVAVDDEDNHEKPELQRRKDVVGFEDVTENFISRLSEETDIVDVISLIGMFGLGKTTLAWKIFNDPRIVYNFPTRIWLSISQEFQEEEIFLQILKEFTTLNDDIRAKDGRELACMVASHLQRGSFLIVMDDVWSSDDWDRLRAALPDDNNKGKVLITSRMREVGTRASKGGFPRELRFLTFEESWELLRLEALGTLECPPELEDFGRKIARDCNGQPLAIVVIGGILASMSSSSSDTDGRRRRRWEKVSERVSSYLFEEDNPMDRMQKYISLSYDTLPYHLRACFLYLGLFPEDYEIPVSKLIRMWIGEGFIQQKVDSSMEETALEYLEDLINRNLVKSVKFKPDGKVKTCQFHDSLREFCCEEAQNEHFLREIRYYGFGHSIPSPSDIDTYRRLSIHANCLDFISSRPYGHRVRSFVCFSKDKYVVSPENSTNIIEAFKLLRVLDVQPLKFTKIDSDLYNLFHLRYIAMSCELSILPSKFNQFRNIQTLIVDTTCRTLDVKADIWKMKHLRHFKTNASAALPESTVSHNNQSAELQTLGLISVESCTEELSRRAPNLKKLGIRGRLALLFDKRDGSFDCLGKMEQLGKLKLINDVYPNPRREGGLRCLPGHDRFPPGLTSLTLCATYLSWDHMSTLGLLKKLKVLKLRDHAFVGRTWRAQDKGFPCLEFLHIEQTDLAYWMASSLSYPNLRSLVLKNCQKLGGIPMELANIPSFEMLELYICIYAAESAKYISDAKRETNLAEGSAFMISIYPPVQ